MQVYDHSNKGNSLTPSPCTWQLNQRCSGPGGEQTGDKCHGEFQHFLLNRKPAPVALLILNLVRLFSAQQTQMQLTEAEPMSLIEQIMAAGARHEH